MEKLVIGNVAVLNYPAGMKDEIQMIFGEESLRHQHIQKLCDQGDPALYGTLFEEWEATDDQTTKMHIHALLGWFKHSINEWVPRLLRDGS